MPREGKTDNSTLSLRIGAGDDITGLLLERIIQTGQDIKIDSSNNTPNESLFYDFAFKDCCSNIAQWALSSEEIDMAFYCNHMALNLVRENPNFEIYAPIIMNAEVLAYKGNLKDIHIVGISHKREHLHNLIRDTYKHIEDIIQITPVALPYSLETSQIDGAVLDITKASLLPNLNFSPISEEDYISYCLVVRKDIIGTKAFNEFKTYYNRVVEELNDVNILKKHIKMPDEFWENARIKFLSIE